MPGLDVQDTTAAITYLGSRPDVDPARIALVGIGQGGMTALYTTAVDRRVAVAVVADYFQPRERCWEEPVDRRLPAQLLEFGDAELAALIARKAQTDTASILSFSDFPFFFEELVHPDAVGIWIGEEPGPASQSIVHSNYSIVLGGAGNVGREQPADVPRGLLPSGQGEIEYASVSQLWRSRHVVDVYHGHEIDGG